MILQPGIQFRRSVDDAEGLAQTAEEVELAMVFSESDEAITLVLEGLQILRKGAKIMGFGHQRPQRHMNRDDQGHG